MSNIKDVKIIPTCVPQSAEDARAHMQKVSAFSKAIHLDIDDGIFTPQVSWPFNKKGNERREVEGIDRAIDIPVDNFLIQIHLMASDGREVGEKFIQAGAGSIIMHCESSIDAAAFTDTLGAFAMLGVREIGIAILVDTPLEKLDPLLPFCDFIQVMSVASIGAQGAPFDPRAIDRVKEIRTRFPSHPVEVDGGINLTNIASLVQAGAMRFAIGAAIERAADPAQAYADLKSAAENALQ
jgi:ribulose-phosphate 3-epimerase